MATTVQPARNGITSGALEPVQQAVSPAAAIDEHTARVQDAVQYPAAVVQNADPIQGPTGAHGRATGVDGSSPMEVVRCLTIVLCVMPVQRPPMAAWSARAGSFTL